MGTSWEQLADKGSDQGVPTWEQNGGNHGIRGAAATRRRRHNGARHLASGRSTDGGEVRRRPQPPSGRQAFQDVGGAGGQPLARGTVSYTHLTLPTKRIV